MALFGTIFARKNSANPAAAGKNLGTGWSSSVLSSQDASLRSAATQRELRAQAVHRLQVGMFGLAGMLLLVSLANVIMDRAQSVDASQQDKTAPASANASPASDPLVDMGVAPELPVAGKPATDPAKAPPARKPGNP
jgi:predicted lipid-binding transport protein (Tim44 family)